MQNLKSGDEILRQIEYLRWEILINSYLYYSRDVNLISDFQFDDLEHHLVFLQERYPEESEQAMFADAFRNFEGSTGCYLPYTDAEVIYKGEERLKQFGMDEYSDEWLRNAESRIEERIIRKRKQIIMYLFFRQILGHELESKERTEFRAKNIDRLQQDYPCISEKAIYYDIFADVLSRDFDTFPFIEADKNVRIAAASAMNEWVLDDATYLVEWLFYTPFSTKHMLSATDKNVVQAISKKRKQILVLCLLYYEFRLTIFNDKSFDLLTANIVELQATYPKLASNADFANAFLNYDGANNHLLPYLNPEIAKLAEKIMYYIF